MGECSEWICFWATLASVWPSSGHKMIGNGGFRPLSEKVFMQSIFKLGVHTYSGRHEHFYHLALIMILAIFLYIAYVCNEFFTHPHGIFTHLGRVDVDFFLPLTYWLSVQNWFAFGPCWPNFGYLVATKWLKMVVSDCYLKKYSHNIIQSCCLHLCGITITLFISNIVLWSTAE